MEVHVLHQQKRYVQCYKGGRQVEKHTGIHKHWQGGIKVVTQMSAVMHNNGLGLEYTVHIHTHNKDTVAVSIHTLYSHVCLFSPLQHELYFT